MQNPRKWYTQKLMNDLFTKNWTDDSRLVKPGGIFMMVPCAKAHENALEALSKGASVIIGSPSLLATLPAGSCQFIPHANPRLAVAEFASKTYPAHPEICFAVTGTNGKSSVVSFAMQLLFFLGYKTASLGTLGVERYGFSSTVSTSPLTTLGPQEFHQTLEKLFFLGVTHFAFEASSHGLDQYRLHRAPLTAACYTNLSLDHLDYHKTWENYAKAKEKLFSEILGEGKTAVLNADSTASFDALFQTVLDRKQKCILYSTQKTLEKENTRQVEEGLWIQEAQTLPEGISFQLFSSRYPGENFSISLPFWGFFQIENVLASLGLLRSIDIPLKKILPLLPRLQAVKGRLEKVGKTAKGASIFVDYAHTPDALQHALQSLKAHMPQGKLFVVFGCGGDRDASKRPLMGAIAARYADEVIITDDNPRFENAAHIRQEILKTCPQAREFSERREAIVEAISCLQQNDCLLIAGKGHETYQLVKGNVFDFDDSAVVHEALESAFDT